MAAVKMITLIMVAGLLMSACNGEYENKLEVPSPDGKLIACVYWQDGFLVRRRTRVNIRPSTRPFGPGRDFLRFGGGFDLGVDWIDNGTLLINMPRFPLKRDGNPNVYELERQKHSWGLLMPIGIRYTYYDAGTSASAVDAKFDRI